MTKENKVIALELNIEELTKVSGGGKIDTSNLQIRPRPVIPPEKRRPSPYRGRRVQFD